MTEFKAGDRVRRTDNADEGVVDDFNRNDVFVLFDNGNRLWVPSHRITPTAPTPAWAPMAGEWAAVLVEQLWTYDAHTWVSIEGGNALHASTLHPLPPMAAEDAALIAAAEAWVVCCFRDRDAPSGAGFTPECVELVAAVRARAKPAQEAPMAEKQRWGAATAAAFTDALHADGDDSEADAADDADERGRQVVALKERVVEAAMKLCSERKERFENGPPMNVTGRAVWDAVEALRAAQTPPAPVDPVTELQEAAADVAEHADRAGIRTTAMWEEQLRRIARLRAALAAMERTP